MSIKKYLPSLHARIRPTEIFWLLRQLSTLLSAHIPLAQALQILAATQPRAVMRHLLEQIIAALNNGLSLAQALRQHPHYFSPFTCQLIQTGEQTANLPFALLQWIAYQEQLHNITQRMRKALFYPSLVLGISFLITLGLFIFIVPQFAELFARFQTPLPLLTRIVLWLADKLAQMGGKLLFIISVGSIGSYIAQRYWPVFARHLAAWRLRLPVAGRWQRYALLSRILRTLALTLSAQLPLLDGLRLSKGIAAHWQYQQALEGMHAAIAEGETLTEAMRTSGRFEGFTLQLVHTGEQSGQLATMLQKAAEWYDSRLDEAVLRVSQWLEPMVMLILGVLIGGLVIALYLPIFQLGKVL